MIGTNFENLAVTSSEGVATIRLNRPEAANGPTRAFAKVKHPLMETFNNGQQKQMELEGRTISAQTASPDGQEGISAFQEKRVPNFTGA